MRCDPQDAGPAASALEQLIDLACESCDYDYFRSDDPVVAAGFVVSDAAAALWAWTWERHGFQTFAETAAPQLIRWESRHGWTRYGEGSVAAKETPLAVVLARMLRVPDTWEGFAEQYVRALDGLSDGGVSVRRIRRFGQTEQERAGALAEWHSLLLEHLADTEGGLLDRIAGHSALGGPQQTFLCARLAHRRGNTDVTRDLIAECLRKLPGYKDFHDFAEEVGASPGVNAADATDRARPVADRRPSARPLFSPRPACPRHFWYPRRAGNASTMAVTHHTTIAEYANGDGRFHRGTQRGVDECPRQRPDKRTDATAKCRTPGRDSA